MASKYSRNEVLHLVLEGPPDESDSEDDFDGYVNDDNMSVISRQHDDDQEFRRADDDSNNIDNDSENEEDNDVNYVQSKGVMSDEFVSLPDFSGYSSCSKDMSN